jgi:hypothetical protein
MCLGVTLPLISPQNTHILKDSQQIVRFTENVKSFSREQLRIMQ